MERFDWTSEGSLLRRTNSRHGFMTAQCTLEDMVHFTEEEFDYLAYGCEEHESGS